MWVLENANETGRVHYLPCGSLLMVSRKEGHILLQGDNSISRQHASITIHHSIENLKSSRNCPEVRLRDHGAKYGTYVNDGIERDEKIRDERVLSDGDRIRFGMLTNTWRLKYRALVTTTSALSPESKGELQKVLVKLGGHLLTEWNSSCSYLVMNNITLTIKVVCALAAARHIVKPEFFSTLFDAVTRKIDHPEPSQFLPPLQEMSINQSSANFSPDERRKQVLSGRNFIFPSAKQVKRMGLAVTLAGGNALLLSDENFQSVSSTNYILVQLPPEKSQDPEKNKLFKAAKEILKGKGLRVIPESDIGLAILYVSTEAHCNPSFAVSSLLRRNGSSMTQADEAVHIYATETQDTDENSVSLTGTRVVPESGVSSSRRTPATLPGTSFPLSNSGVKSTLMNSSSASTNASILVPPDNALPSRSDLEDKENVMQAPSKRIRSCSGPQFAEPKSKRSNRTSDNSNQPEPEPEPTQPMEEQIDEEGMSQDCAVLKFEPQHVSTQRNDTSNDRTVMNEDVRSPSRRPDLSTNSPNVNRDMAVMPNGGDPSLEPTVGRSIPFEPYTLPSLNVDPYREDDIETEPFANVKEEPASLPIDGPDCYSGKRRREEELDVREGEGISAWLGKKKTRTDNSSNVPIKQERRSFNNDRTTNPNAVKQELLNDDDLFSLPNTSERSKRRAEAKRKHSVEGTSANADDLFDLPISSRAERRRKVMKIEEEITRKSDSRGTIKEAVTVQRDQQIATTSNSSRSTSVNESRRTDNSSNGNWISKKSEGTGAAAANSPVKAEAVTTNISKNEPKYGDVAELTGALEKSLVVVEVASLVRRREKDTVSASKPQNTSNGKLKNFKKFKKCASDIISLPKIIGGKDLVAHDVAEVSGRDGWFRDNPDVSLLFEDRQAQERANDDELDAMFDLPQNPRSRARMRR